MMPVPEHAEWKSWAVPVPPGYRVGGWEVVSGIASGSWGSVYGGRKVAGAARSSREYIRGSEDVPDTVALKFLPTGTLTPRQISQLADMAAREVQFSRAPGHRHTVRTYETLVVDDPACPTLDGAVVLVMERARQSLQGTLDAAAADTPGAPVTQAGRMIAGIAVALADLHAAGWVHGDLKPANILVATDGSLRLADFGLAAELEGTHAYAPPAGTRDYLPPERWEEQLGERGVVTRTSADIWALGVTAHQLLSGGEYPFPGATVSIRVAAAREYAEGRAVLRLSGAVPQKWREFIADCLQPCHASRAPHDAAALAARAERLASTDMGEGGLPAERSGAGGPLRLTRSRWRLPVMVAAPLCGLALLVTGGVVADAMLESASPADPMPAAVSSGPYRPDLLRTGVGIPERYRPAIVAAGTGCSEPGVSPVLVAAMLQAESGFNPHLSDSQENEYGIARWTPRVLAHYATGEPEARTPRPPFPPRQSILALGRYLCWNAPQLTHMRGNHALLLAAAFRTSTDTVAVSGGIPPELRPYIRRVQANLERYTPR